LHHIAPRFRAYLIPVERRQHFEQLVLASIFERSLVDAIPDARARRIDVAMFLGRATARSVTRAFGALHRADQRGFLHQTVAANPAAGQPPLGAALEPRQRSAARRISLERVERGLAAPAWGEDGLLPAAFSVRVAGRVFHVTVGFIVRDGPGAYK